MEDNGLNSQILLLEYRNIVNQRIDLMIDHKFSLNTFENVLKSISNYDCYNDVLEFLPKQELLPYLELLKIQDIIEVYNKANKQLTLKRKIRFQLKKIISKLNYNQ